MMTSQRPRSLLPRLFVLLAVSSVIAGGNNEDGDEIPVDIRHHDYKDMIKYMNEIHKKCPDITRIYDIGESVRGRKLQVIEMTELPGNHTLLKPEFKYVGNMHGNEVVGREMLLYLMDYMCQMYNGKDAEIQRLVRETRIHVMPSMNPDGYEVAVKSTRCPGNIGTCCQGTIGRPNANNVDLNRNFPDQYARRNPSEELETQEVIKWIKEHPFVLSANLHGGSLVANYPFDDNREFRSGLVSPAPDNQVFRHVALTYSQHHPTMPNGNPCEGDHFKQGVTNGADWYSVAGGMQDFNYVESNCFEITVEMGCCKFPLASALPRLWLDHRPPLLAFMRMVHMGVKGTVRHAGNGAPHFGAVISVVNVTNGQRTPIDHSIRVTNYGDYFRLLTPGLYEVTATVGKRAQTVTVCVVGRPAVVIHFTVGADTFDAKFETGEGTICKPNDQGVRAINDEVSVRELLDQQEARVLDSKQQTEQVEDSGANFAVGEEQHDAMDKSIQKMRRHSSRSDNVVAAVVIVTIGCLVCLLAGIVLYRKVKELKKVKEGYGYEKVDPDQEDDADDIVIDNP